MAKGVSVNGHADGLLVVDCRSGTWTSQPKKAGLAYLLQAYDCAQELRRDPWDFAVEISQLRQFGLTVNDFRWLTCRGYVAHARDVTKPDAKGREFRATCELLFPKRTCFVLTQTGVEFARRLCETPDEPSVPVNGDMQGDDCLACTRVVALPHWDCDLRELRVGTKLVKRFRLRSPNQEAVLMAFEEEGWPTRIDDPLPPRPDCDPKERLHDTIRSLNRNQKNELIRFKGDGTGEGVLWEWAPAARRPTSDE